MLFNPTNAPAFYTVMMKFLRDNSVLLFQETKYTIAMINSPSHNVCDDLIIIDDIL